MADASPAGWLESCMVAVPMTPLDSRDPDRTTCPDVELLDRWQAGDPGAGQALFGRHFDAIYRFFANKSSDPDELVQATFLACLHARARFRKQASFRTFLFAIARNTLLHHLRGLSRARRFDPEHSSIADLVTTPATRIARREEQERLRVALRALPVEQQTLLELHYWEDLDAAALGEVFDLPAGTMRVRLHRARHALRAAMEQPPADAGAPPRPRSRSIEELDDWARAQRDLVPPPHGDRRGLR